MADDADDGEAILLSDDAAVVMAEAEDTTDAAAIIMTTSKLQPHSIMSHRGINNVNGTACHTSSALQLIFHCFPLLREALLELAPVCAEFYLMGQRKRSSRSANKGAEIVQNEFVYQLSWFFYLLAYDEDVLEVSKASLADELYESSSAVAAAAGADAEVLEANAKGTIEESKSSEEHDAKDAKSEFRTLLNEASARPPRKQKQPKQPSSPNSRASRKSNRPPRSPDSRGASRSRRSRRSHNRHTASSSRHTDSASHAAGDESKAATRKSKSGLKKPTEMNPLQRAAIEAFMARARSGQSAKGDWEHLVNVMKEDNRVQYGEALNKALSKHGGSGENVLADGVKTESENGEVEKKSIEKGVETKTTEKKQKENNGDWDWIDNNANGSTAAAAGNLGGGRGSNNDNAAATESTSAIDPTSFYQHLTTYTSLHDTKSHVSSSMHINVNNVGDAAMVFRCLISALEYSTKNEVDRLQEVMDVMEIDDWNDDGKEEYDDELDQQRVGKGKGVSERQLKSSLDQVSAAMHASWSGTLLSRIVGTSTSTTTNVDNPMIPLSTKETTITTLQRTKKGGNIERPLPIPFPLPVVRQGGGGGGGIVGMTVISSKSKKEKKQSLLNIGGDCDDQSRYFENLETSLKSVTIGPNPIRGYDWRGLMKRGEVVEVELVKKFDGGGNEILDDSDGEELKDEKELGIDHDLGDELIKKVSMEGSDGDVTAKTERLTDRSSSGDTSDEMLGDEELARKILRENDARTERTKGLSDSAGSDNSRGEETAIGDDFVTEGGDVFLNDVNNVVENDRNSSISVANNVVVMNNDDDDVDETATLESNCVGEAAIQKDDDISIVSTNSRTIACQADFGYDMGTQTAFDEEGKVIHGMNEKTIEVGSRKDKEGKEGPEVETAKKGSEAIEGAKEENAEKVAAGAKKESEPPVKTVSATPAELARSKKFAIEKDSCYAAAVIALVSARRGTSVASRSSYVGRRNRDRDVDDRSHVRGTSVDHSSYASRGTSVDRSYARGNSVDSRGSSYVRGTSIERRGRNDRSTSVERRGRNDVPASVERRGRSVRGSSVSSRDIENRSRYRRDTSVDSYHSYHGSYNRRGTSMERGSYRRGGTSVDGRSSNRVRGTSPFDRKGEMKVNDSPAAPAGSVTLSYGASPNEFASLPGITTPSGMEVGPSPQGVTMSYMPSPTTSDVSNENKAMLPSDSDDSSSEEESSVDSKVSSVDTSSSDDTDTTAEVVMKQRKQQGDGQIGGVSDLLDDASFSTRSSAIETPPNIDDLSLGSFTDDSLSEDAEDEKKEEIIAVPSPALLSAAKDEIMMEDENIIMAPTPPPAVTPKTDNTSSGDNKKDLQGMEIAPPQSVSSNSHSALSSSTPSNLDVSGYDTDDDDSSSSSGDSSSSSSSSSSSDDTSSTDSSSSSTSEESSDDDDGSSSSDENFTNAVAAAERGSSTKDVHGDDERNSNGNVANNDVHKYASIPINNNKAEWITRKETRLCHPLPQSLIFHLKRFEYSNKMNRVEKLGGCLDIPQELDVKSCCLVEEEDESKKNGNVCSCYRYRLSGAIVHVDPILDENEEDELEFGQTSEGHYVTFIRSSAYPTTASNSSAEDAKKDDPQDESEDSVWTEFDDEFVRIVDPPGDLPEDDRNPALKILSGCEVSNDHEKQRSSSNGGTSKRVVKEKERRYATLVVYSRACQCTLRAIG